MRPAARIEEVRFELRPFTLRLAQPVRGATARHGFIVEAHRGGRVGRGEACIVPEVGTESLQDCERELRSGLQARTPAARHGVDQALLDLEAQEAGIPLARLLDPQAASSVPCSALLAAHGVAELAREARRAVAEGFRTLKLKVGTGEEFARVAVVRDAAGPDVKLRLDANGAFDAATALRLLRELAPLDLELCEQPTADLRGLEDSPVPVAADELAVTDFEAALARAPIVVLKPMAVGGLSRALALAKRARKAGREVLVTTSLDGAIARAGAAHLAAALRSPFAAGLATGRLVASGDLPDLLPLRDGAIAIPDTPGL